jgi:hypothetical protein
MDLNSTATTISRWTDLGVTIPAKLKEAAELYDTAAYVEGPWTGFDLSKVTTKNLEQTVTDLADRIAVEGKFAEAKQRVRDDLGRQLMAAAGEAVDEIVTALQPRFERAASRFTEAIHMLPEDLSATNLVRTGPAALQAYNDALEAQDELLDVDKFLASLVYLPRYGAKRQDNALRLLRPSDRSQLQALVNVAGSHRPEKFGDLSPLFVTAVREGIPFQTNDPEEWTQLRADIEAQPIKRNSNVRFVNW